MNPYTPDKWIIIKGTVNNKTIFKVLAGWSGSYLEGQSWRINSGITKVEVNDDSYLFHGHSGSVYKCRKTGYGTNGIMNGILDQTLTIEGVELLPDQDFSTILNNEQTHEGDNEV
jgi:hypothetical protein